MTLEEEFGTDTADFLIDDHGYKRGDFETDSFVDSARESYYSMSPVGCAESFREVLDAVFVRVEERLSPYDCACGQTAMPGFPSSFALCADCRTVHEEVGKMQVSETKSPRRPAELLGDWIARPCGTIADSCRR